MAFYIKLLGPSSYRFKVDESQVLTVGRAQDADISLDDKLVSRNHCQLVGGTEHLIVRDLDSRNGTYLNGRRFEGEVLARPGDQIRLGGHHLLVERNTGGSGRMLADPSTLGREQPGDQPLPTVPGYELIEEVGRGTLGRVYRGKALLDEREVAIKMLPNSAAEQALKRFDRSAEALMQLDHPNIVKVYGLSEAAGVNYFIMEFLRGEKLSRMISQGNLSPREALSIAAQVARALALAHDEGVIHRHVSPGNVMVLKGGVVKLLGFGFVKTELKEGQSLTHLGEIVGDLLYSSPEQCRDPRAVDPRSDLYGLGAVLYHAIAGKPPIEGQNYLETLRRVLSQPAPRLKEAVPDIPRQLDELVARLLAKDPADRYPDARAVEHAIDEALLEACSQRDEAADPADTSDRSLGGGFGGSELLEIVQFLEFNEKSGLLKVAGERYQGEIDFAGGLMVRASARNGRLDGKRAALSLLRSSEGTFRFHPLNPPRDEGLALRPSLVALEVTRERDEKARQA